MIRILIGITFIAVGGMALYHVNKVDTYIAPETITNIVTEEIIIDPTEELVTQAIADRRDEIKEAAQARYDETVLQMEKEIELEVRRGQRVIDDSIIEDLEKEVGVY
jgi:phage-related protein